MRELSVLEITKAVKELCIQANMVLPCDLRERIEKQAEAEPFPLAKEVMGDIRDNIYCAQEIGVPICQDTGMAVIFLELGQEVHLTGGDLNAAVDEGVRQGYVEGKLRCSVVEDPLRRINTNDNTPAILHLSIVPGEQVKIAAAPKGFGSENMSAMRMFTPSATKEDIINYIVEQINTAGSNPCPPMVVGVGIGGDFEKCAYLAKKALCRAVSQPNPDQFYADMEQELLCRINQLGIGPQGFGGETTALAVNIEAFPTHIAGLPVAVNVGCHVTRHAEMTL
ncbi:fumarate hydratase [Massiliimalia timonensis]|uniref:fumarate hydratase n=1 Tax=Massiliimalia timonensis TaxID=1987501 RepID=UPI00189C8DFC|nr:fumarate hydratase [Massiliimalia timonensis]